MKWAAAFVCIVALVSFASAQQLDSLELHPVEDLVPRILQEIMGDMGDAAPAGTYGAAVPAAAAETPAVDDGAAPVDTAVVPEVPVAPVQAPAEVPVEAPVAVAPAPVVVAPAETPVETPAETTAAPKPTPIAETPVQAPVQEAATPAPAPVVTVEAETTCPTGTTVVTYTNSDARSCVLPQVGAMEGQVYVAATGQAAVASGTKCFSTACPAASSNRKLLSTQETQSTSGTQFFPFFLQWLGFNTAPAPAPAPTTTTTTTTTYSSTASTPAPAQTGLVYSQCFYVCETA